MEVSQNPSIETRFNEEWSLEGTNLVGAQIDFSAIKGNLHYANLSGQNLANLNMAATSIRGADLSNTVGVNINELATGYKHHLWSHRDGQTDYGRLNLMGTGIKPSEFEAAALNNTHRMRQRIYLGSVIFDDFPGGPPQTAHYHDGLSYWIGRDLTALTSGGNGFWNDAYYLGGQVTTLPSNGTGWWEGMYFQEGVYQEIYEE